MKGNDEDENYPVQENGDNRHLSGNLEPTLRKYSEETDEEGDFGQDLNEYVKYLGDEKELETVRILCRMIGIHEVDLLENRNVRWIEIPNVPPISLLRH